MSSMRDRGAPIEDQAVTMMHPGGAPFGPAPFVPDAERLVRQERELLDLAIERHIHRSGRMADLAISITALRAGVRAA